MNWISMIGAPFCIQNFEKEQRGGRIMAKTKTITIECPKCREAFEIKGYETINASLDEALRKSSLKQSCLSTPVQSAVKLFQSPTR